MKTDKKLLIAGLSLTFFLFLQGCGGGTTTDIESSDDTTTDILLPTTYTVDAGRLLGSQCAQCHGTNGVSTNEWDSIAGEDELEDEIYEDDEPIMMAQAHGYTSEEIILIGNWLKTLSTND
jgi:mono/diheme cytochrome c family protein